MTVTNLVFEEEPIQGLLFEAVNLFQTFLEVALYNEPKSYLQSLFMYQHFG